MKNYKKNFARFLIAVFSAALLNIPVFAVETDTITEQIQREIQVTHNGYEEVKSINKKDLTGSRKLNYNDYESLNSEIVKALDVCGENTVFYQKLAQSLELGDELTVSSKYLKIRPDGEQEVLSREQCLREASQVNAEQLKRVSQPGIQDRNLNQIAQTRAVENDYAEKTFDDQYMYIVVSYLTIDREEYMLMGMAQWLTMPGKRGKDAVSLYCSDVAWGNKFSADVEYDEKTSSLVTGSTEIKHIYNTMDSNAANVMADGFYYDYYLPANYYSSTYNMYYSNYTVTISGIGKVKHPSTLRNFDLYMNYAHTNKNLLEVELAWNVGVLGVSIKNTIFTDSTNYTYAIQIRR